ncbi:hypothetical protein DRQ21_08030 [Candidatus Fermentibacteria bacterium]|nr:MAG: hypothetical protein DRQ21_08030 [Candidatus Fermentibacteria bacterium]
MQSVLTPDTELIQARFSVASSVYDSYAEHHRLIAEEVERIVVNMDPGSLLEAGSGTGILSERLNKCFPRTVKTFTDIAPGMVRTCRKRLPESRLINHRLWNFEKQQCSNSFDLVVSSCALQWAADPVSAVRNLSSTVTAGGYTVHAIPARGMLHELENSFRTEGIRWNRLNYLSGDRWNRLFADAGFADCGSFSKDFTVHYRRPSDVLHAVRGIGASLTGHPGAFCVTPVELRKALYRYSRSYSTEHGTVPATYRIHFVVAKKVLL